MHRDELFLYFLRGAFAVLLLYGVGMAAAIVWASDNVARAMITGFVGMFTGILGLGSGYILGKRNGNS
jgi:hypothetical protein